MNICSNEDERVSGLFAMISAQNSYTGFFTSDSIISLFEVSHSNVTNFGIRESPMAGSWLLRICPLM
ncbi:hypothetical protein P8452_04748 [Trifolium repens]|nr:hypothetical protein P8452_04748 [Trifolium repens]